MKIQIYPKEMLLALWKQNKKWYKSKDGTPPTCLRCGGAMPEDIARSALSRYIDVGVCEKCGTSEAVLDWDGRPMPLRVWYVVQHGMIGPTSDDADATLSPTCSFPEVFQQPRRAVWGHPSGFPMSELCYFRADHDGWRWHNTWTNCQEKPEDAVLLKEVDDFCGSLFELPEFQNLGAMRKFCVSYAEKPDATRNDEYNVYSETEHFHIWLRLVTRERDYNLYGHYFLKDAVVNEPEDA